MGVVAVAVAVVVVVTVVEVLMVAVIVVAVPTAGPDATTAMVSARRKWVRSPKLKW